MLQTIQKNFCKYFPNSIQKCNSLHLCSGFFLNSQARTNKVIKSTPLGYEQSAHVLIKFNEKNLIRLLINILVLAWSILINRIINHVKIYKQV